MQALPAQYNLTIRRQTSLTQPFIFPQADLTYVPVLRFNKTSPISLKTTVDHGVPDDWPVWITEVSGTGATRVERALAAPPMLVSVPDPDTIELRGVDGYGVSLSGGQVCYYPPTRLEDMTDVAFTFWGADDNGNEVALLTVSGPDVAVDPAGRVTLFIPASVTSGLTWENAKYELSFKMGAEDFLIPMGDVLVIGRLLP